MAETAESVVVALEARTGDFDTRITQSARVVDQSMSQVQRSATQAEATVRNSANHIVESHTRMGASGMILQHVIRGTTDQFAAGAPLAQIFAQHIAMLGEAAALSGDSLGAFGRVMSGPWGIALTVGTALLTTLIAGHHGAADAAHRHESAEETLARALNGEADALEKVLEAQRQQNREAAESVQNATQRAAAARIEAQANLDNANALRRTRIERLQQQLDAARVLEAAQSAPSAEGAGATASGLSNTRSNIASLTAQIAEISTQVVADQQALINREIEVDRTLSTHVGRTNTLFDVQESRLQDQRRRSEITQQELIRRENMLTDARARAVHAAQLLDDAEQGRSHRGPGEDVVDRTALLRTALSHVGQTERGNTASLEQFFRGAGINIDPRQLAWCAAFVQAVLAANGLPVARGPDGHPALGARGFLTYGSETAHPEPGDLVVMRRSGQGRNDPNLGHVGFFQGFAPGGGVRVLSGNEGRNGAVGSAVYARADVLAFRRAPTASEAETQAARQQRQAEELAEHRLRDEARFQEQLAALDTAILEARRRRSQTEEESTAADIAAINAERDQRNQRIRDEAAQRTQRDASQAVAANIEAGFLLARSEELADAQRDARLAREHLVLDEQRLEIAQSELRDQTSILQARASLARTAIERRDIELRLLSLQHQEELNAIAKQRLQQNLSPAQRGQLDRDEAAANARYGLGQQNVIRQTAGPLQAFLADIPHTANEMNEALQHVAVDGMQAFNDGLGQAISRFHLLGGVADQVLGRMLSDIVEIILRQGELAAFGGGKGGGFSGFLSSIASIFGHGGGGAYAGELLPGSGAVLPGFASGGAQMVGGAGGVDNNIVSINGRARFRASGNETIAVIPQGKALSFGGARAASSASQQPVQVELHVAAGEHFDARVAKVSEGVSVRVVRSAAPNIIGASVSASLRAVPARLTQYQSDGL